MSNDKWERHDEDVGRWLSSIPKPEDGRTPEEVLVRLKADPRLSEKPPSRRRKWIPLGVAAAAVLATSILIPSLLGGDNEISMNDTSNEQANGASSMRESSESEMSIAEDSSQEMARSSTPSDIQNAPNPGAVYPADIEGFMPFRIGLVDEATVVPVTFLIPDAVVAGEFEEDEPDQVELYNHFAPQIDEEALGFDDYHPYLGTLSSVEDRVSLTLSEEHSYDFASAAIRAFTESLQETFGEESILLKSADGGIAEFDQVGPLDEVNLDRSGAVYFAYEKSDGTTVLAPDRHIGPADPAEAIYQMKGRNNDLYEPVIPPEADFIVESPTEGGDVLTIRFNESFDLDSLELQDAVLMIDGIALTASEYGFRVRLENVTNLPDGYALNDVLELPIGPNGTVLESDDTP